MKKMKKDMQQSRKNSPDGGLDLRADRGSVSKGLILAILFLALGTAVTLYFVIPSEESINQGKTSGLVDLPLVDQESYATPLPTPNYATVPETMLEVEYNISYSVGGKKQSNSSQVRYFQAGDFYSRRESKQTSGLLIYSLNLLDIWILWGR